MLEIFNNLEPFFKDNYEEINVRGYARIMNISPPTASKMLNKLEREKILKSEKYKGYILYKASRESKLFVTLSRAHWSIKLKETGLIDYLAKELINPLVILFGSFSKGEINSESDIDLAVFSVSKKNLKMDFFEKKLGRKIQLFAFSRKEDVKNENLLNNILNGEIITGSW